MNPLTISKTSFYYIFKNGAQDSKVIKFLNFKNNI